MEPGHGGGARGAWRSVPSSRRPGGGPRAGRASARARARVRRRKGAALAYSLTAALPWCGLALLAASTVPLAAQSRQAGDRPLVFHAVVDAVIHPVSADYMIAAIRRADEAQAELLVFTLRTPGGLVDSTREIT